MGLQQEIDKQRQEIKTDEYSMSIGEWISLYGGQEIDIHPEFQRFYRWTHLQKTRLIESILLGIPIPPIFVTQREDGVWDVVDGLQRLSTILQFVGILCNEADDVMEPLVLEGTDYLPSLEGKKWDDPNDKRNSLTQTQRLIIRRTRLTVSIILKESDVRTKYDLFQRLNTGGSPLSSQEVRNCILVMINRNMYSWMRDLADNKRFQECVSVTERAKDEQYDLELVLRFLVFRTLDKQYLTSTNIGDLNQFLTKQMVQVAGAKDFDRGKEEEAFKHTFDILAATTGGDSLRKYDVEKDKFTGPSLVSAFETVALGIGFNHRHFPDRDFDVEEAIKDLWRNEEFKANSGTGVRASSRIPKIVPLGRKLFRP